MLAKQLRDKLLSQALREIKFDREYKEHRYSQWSTNQDLYAGKQKDIDESRSHIMLPKMQGFVDTLLSKVDSPPNIKYVQGEEADRKKAQRANALIEQDSSPSVGRWAFKDLLGKKQGIIYGRAMFEYHASSNNKYKSNLSNVDVYDFFIDPMAGGVDIEKAKHLGRKGVFKSESELKEGSKNGLYHSKNVTALVQTKDNTDESREEKEKNNRYYKLSSGTKREQSSDNYELFEWYTTYKGKRYYLLLHEDAGIDLRIEELKDIFKSNLYPFVTYATHPDLSEFWTPAPADQVAQIFMGQSVLVNQLFDNNEAINRPMKAFDSGAIENPSLLRYRKDGNIPLKAGTDINRAFTVIRPEALQNNERMYELLDQIAQVESGITGASKGIAEEDKVGIYEGNIANTADRLGLLNKSYSDAYHRLGLLYYYGLKEHMNNKIAVKMIGNDGIDYEEITKGDVMPQGREFDVQIQASDLEANADSIDKKNKLTFLTQYQQDPTKNQKAIFEIQAEITGLETADIKRILDLENNINTDLMSEAMADFQKMVKGDILEPNQKATIAYKQQLVDELRDKGSKLKEDTQKIIIAYIKSLDSIIERNMGREAQKQIKQIEAQQLTQK